MVTFYAEEYHIPDPSLSELGLEQCKSLNEHLRTKQPLAERIELIIASPLRRTLQTSLVCFDWLIERGIRVIPDANWQGKSLTCRILTEESAGLPSTWCPAVIVVLMNE